ncbi:hypothetical protein [Actinomadura macrotermitis]|uniref:Uncharacterized protein n=1 Tax=Actinomadura macrotermitis TaxID=2585200 RepID=A0A7K0C1D7_9ACTN|nr:hypothetical protein [Actinomadura macrotermitis]MQY07257.1 hypothetical protein [Actinomadura macrotermitis]
MTHRLDPTVFLPHPGVLLPATVPSSGPPSPTPTGPPGTPGGEHGQGGLIVVALLFGLIWALGYRVSIRLHPFKSCGRCSGSGKHRGTWFTGAYRACDRCGGTGREHRMFARDPYKQNPSKRRRQE